MSTGLECRYIEVKTAVWYYVLEDGNAPKNAWDWMEYATATGPFPSFDLAYEHLHHHHANPGGYFEDALPPGQTERSIEPDSTLAKLLADALSPQPVQRGPYSRGGRWTRY